MNFSGAVFAGLGLGLIVTIFLLTNSNHNLNNKIQTLTRENQTIAKQNRDYTKCIATIFAQYTHDFVPITILDLDTCTIDSQKAQSAGAGSQPELQTGAKGDTGAQGSRGNPGSAETPPTPSKPVTQQVRDFVGGIVDSVRGMHL